ncbi:hypothetical protein L1987_34875 [Smallanthus sonchifolius]|uniref:Uncharacterized protein n=1 Tax=Smallanthus sonchifolius TaxID=185202 RepID=A0ACB9HW98_9ASTR|nr:hypothetical protein L1987_34875 [Smallanthus sonchifolius]
MKLIVFLRSRRKSSDTNSGIKAEGLGDIASASRLKKGCRNVNGVKVAASGQDGDDAGVATGANRTKGVRGKQISHEETSKGKKLVAIKKKSITKGFARLMINDRRRVTLIVRKVRRIKTGTKKTSMGNLKSKGKTRAVLKEDRHRNIRCFNCQQLGHITIYSPRNAWMTTSTWLIGLNEAMRMPTSKGKVGNGHLLGKSQGKFPTKVWSRKPCQCNQARNKELEEEEPEEEEPDEEKLDDTNNEDMEDFTLVKNEDSET